MLLMHSMRYLKCCSAVSQGLWRSEYSSTTHCEENDSSDEKVQRIWVGTRSYTPDPGGYRDCLIKALSGSLRSDESSQKVKHSQVKLLKELENIPSVGKELKLNMKVNPKMVLSHAYELAAHNVNLDVLDCVSSFSDENKEEMSRTICPAASLAWRVLLQKMDENINLQESHLNRSSYSAFLMELMKAERVRALSLTGTSFAGQHVDDSIYQLMRMFRVQKELDLDSGTIIDLSLASMGIGDQGCDHISGAFEEGLLQQVKCLSLHGNEIGGRSAERLCGAIIAPGNTLQAMDLSLNYLDEASVQRVAMTALKKYDLEVCLVGNNIKWAS
jgi:hypothetical protein